MRWKRLNDAGGRAGRLFADARAWLRRVMPRVALGAFLLFVARLFAAGTNFIETPVGALFDFVTFLAVCWTLVYYGIKALREGKRRLLWRVRRRLVITYLFVGLTPIVLLLLLGTFAAVGGSSQAMVKVVSVQVLTTERQALDAARALAASFLNLPSNATERNVREWLDANAPLLGATLPGARVAVWRGPEAEGPALGQKGEPIVWRGPTADDDTRGVGGGEDAGAPLPDWLAGHEEWSGVAYLPPPAESDSAFGSPSLRALVRAHAPGRSVAVLVTVPVCRALVRQYRERTGVHVRPFFLSTSSVTTNERGTAVTFEGDPDVELRGQDRVGERVVFREGERRREVDFRVDQFGEPVPNTSFFSFGYPVFLDATNWQTGARGAKWAFMVDWSLNEGARQFWGDAMLGQAWRRLLYGLAVAFLVLELLALFGAAWMTRRVTGMVHKLYRATESVKRGDFSHRIHVRSRDQLGELADAFNDMSANIESLLADRVERERLEREIEIAHDVQAQLFPRSVPAMAGAEITGECRAARGVAGDYYDYVEVAPGLVAFALGDVSGKGLSASLVMSNLQAALRARVAVIGERLKASERAASHAAANVAGGVGDAAVEAARGDGEGETAGRAAVARVASSLNAQLCQSTESNRFATLFLALYDERARTLRYTNAGHNAPVLARRDGRVERLSAGGLMVGAFEWAEYEEAQVPLEEGDTLVVFSDGIVEAQNHAGEEFGDDRLVQLVVANRDQPASDLRRLIFDEIDRWAETKERDDDQTVVILKAT